MEAARKYFNNGEKRGKFNNFFRVLRERQNLPRISVLKIKRYGTGLTQGYNWYEALGNGPPTATHLYRVSMRLTDSLKMAKNI